MARRRKRWWMALGSGLAYWGWRRWRGGGEQHAAGSKVDRESRERGHEPEDRTNVRFLTIAAVGLLLSVVVILFLVGGLFSLMQGHFAEGPVPFAGFYPEDPPGPELQADPAIDLQTMHERENARLLHYGWINKRRGIVNIPIERAMTLIAKRGLPTRDSSAYRDSVRVPTESGFRIIRRGLPVGSPPPYLGSSPEPYTTNPELREDLNDEELLREE